MLTFLGGGRASASLRELAKAGATALVDATCWLGDTAAGAAHHVWVSWEDEEYTRGGYAYLDPAYDPAWRALLSRQSGRVLFAGEHTSDDWQGYMEGAVQSGLDAARTIMAPA
jgi:monoamine oxidase